MWRTVEEKYSVNPVREQSSIMTCDDGDFKTPLVSNGNDHQLKSLAFSNGVKVWAPKYVEILRKVVKS